MAGSVDHKKFIARMAERFPEVVDSIDDCSRGLLQLEMGTLAVATQAAIDAQDKEVVKRHFRFIDEILRDAAPDVENAVNVSYLEHLRFEGRKAAPTQARGLLSPRLERALADLDAYRARLRGGKS